jgi:hypothetical protein
MTRVKPLCALTVVLAVAAVGVSHGSTAAAGTGNSVVRIPRGQPVQIAVVVDTHSAIPYPPSTIGGLGVGIRNAIQMAVGRRTIRGFPIQLNVLEAAALAVDDPNLVADNAAVAQQVVSNTQNVAVIGHETSLAFGNVPPSGNPCPGPTNGSALSVYQSYGLVTINGSTTNPCLPFIGTTTFNSTAVPDSDPNASTWLTQVKGLPIDRLWQQIYTFEFGLPTTDFADLYFDATNLLLTRLNQVSTIANGKLVIDRAALAKAVRNTTNFPGVTCTVSFDAGGYRINDQTALNRCGG